MIQPDDHAGPRHLALRPRLTARALALGERLDVRPDPTNPQSNPRMVDAGDGAIMVLFRYGTIVLFDFSEQQTQTALERLAGRITDPYDRPEAETVEIIIDSERREGVDSEAIVLHEPSMERLQVVAEILGKSVALAQEEQAVSAVFDRLEPLAVDLQRRGKVGRRSHGLLRHIGNALLVQYKTVARVEVGEKPELLWERPDLERLYLRLEEEYELRERHTALERKLRLISDTAETLLEVVQTRRSLRVEWYIVILIVVEIILTLYDLFLRR